MTSLCGLYVLKTNQMGKIFCASLIAEPHSWIEKIQHAYPIEEGCFVFRKTATDRPLQKGYKRSLWGKDGIGSDQ